MLTNNQQDTLTKTNLREFLITEIFPALRKNGLLARANAACCSSCAGYELAETLKKNANKIGYVYWNRQDEDGFNDRKEPGVYLGFDGREETDIVNVATRVVAAITAAAKPDVYVEWDGTANTKIWVGVKS